MSSFIKGDRVVLMDDPITYRIEDFLESSGGRIFALLRGVDDPARMDSRHVSELSHAPRSFVEPFKVGSHHFTPPVPFPTLAFRLVDDVSRDIAGIARTLFTIDQRVIEFVVTVADATLREVEHGPLRYRGQPIPIAVHTFDSDRIRRATNLAWELDQNGWRTEAELKAAAILGVSR